MSASHASQRAWRELDRIHDRKVNFDLERAELCTAKNGWVLDDYCAKLPAERPGPPEPGGCWETAVELMTDYEFADPSIVEAVYYPDRPLKGRTMLLVGKFYGLRFRLGVRVGGVIDELSRRGGREVRVWGWSYHTLQGHLEMGQMHFEVRKWLDTGEVEFRIHAFSKPARIRNPIVRVGFAVFGRGMQKKFARRALERMKRLTEARLSSGEEPGELRSFEESEVSPARDPASSKALDRAED